MLVGDCDDFDLKGAAPAISAVVGVVAAVCVVPPPPPRPNRCEVLLVFVLAVLIDELDLERTVHVMPLSCRGGKAVSAKQ